MSTVEGGARARAQRIVLLSNGSLMSAAVHRLLGADPGLEICVLAEHDPDIVAKLRDLAPRVIMLDSGNMAATASVITRILHEHPQAKVIALNLDRADIEVYRMKRVVRADAEGLLDAIRGKPTSAKETLPNARKARGRGVAHQ